MTPIVFLLSPMLLPLFGGLILLGAGKKTKLRDSIYILSSIVTFMACVNLYLNFSEVGRIEVLKLTDVLSLSFSIEPLGLCFILMASCLWIPTSLYSIAYIHLNKEHNQTTFLFYFSMAMSITMGIALSDNLFTMFLFYELLTLSTLPLVMHHRDDASISGGKTYLSYLLGTSIIFQLSAIILIYSLTGTLQFQSGGIFLDQHNQLIGIVYVIFVFGVGKAALMPFHRWLPAAMVAPTPVSALLHAVAVVKAGVFTILKVSVYIFGIETLNNIQTTNLVLYVSGMTIIIASIIALYQDNLKKRLAYSTISQLSYIVMATAIASPQAVLAAAYHIVAHAFAKITLFFSAGSIYTITGKNSVSQLDGIAKQLPLTMLAFSIAVISMIGLPPTIGFTSKLFILSSATEEGDYIVLLVLVISTLLNAGYFLPILYRAYFTNSEEEYSKKRLHVLMTVPILFTAAMTVLLFFYSDFLIQYFSLWNI